MRKRFAHWLMDTCYRIVERIDRSAVPKMSPFAFTFEANEGAVINATALSSKRRGCRLLYENDTEYERSWTDSATLAEPTQ